MYAQAKTKSAWKNMQPNYFTVYSLSRYLSSFLNDSDWLIDKFSNTAFLRWKF